MRMMILAMMLLMIFMNYFWWIILKHCFVNELVKFRNVVKVCLEKKTIASKPFVFFPPQCFWYIRWKVPNLYPIFLNLHWIYFFPKVFQKHLSPQCENSPKKKKKKKQIFKCLQNDIGMSSMTIVLLICEWVVSDL